MSKSVLSAKDVTYLYPSGRGAKEISLELRKGEFLVLAGPNGAGKSTLLKMLIGKLQAQRGEICIGKTNIRKLKRKEFAQTVAYITQSPSQAPITLWDYISLGYYSKLNSHRFWLQKKEKEHIEDMMHFVGLAPSLDQKINELSGGEMQLAQICRALLQEPEILLMDEPVAHLDPGHAIIVLDLVDKLRREKGISVISVLHEINLAADYADRILFLNESKLIAEGTPRELLTSSFLSDLYGVPIAVEERKSTGNPAIFPTPMQYQKS